VAETRPSVHVHCKHCIKELVFKMPKSAEKQLAYNEFRAVGAVALKAFADNVNRKKPVLSQEKLRDAKFIGFGRS